MENHNCRTVISRYLLRLAILALLAWSWTAARAQFNNVPTNGGATNPQTSGGNPNGGYPNGGYGNGGYGGYGNGGYGNGGYGGYGNGGYGGYGNGGYGGYGNGGYGNGGYGGYGSGMSSGFGSSGFGSSGFGSSGFGSSRFGQGSSRFGRNGDSDSGDSSSSGYGSRRNRSRNGSDQNGRNSRNKNDKSKKNGKGTQTQQSTRSMGKENVSQRKTTGTAKTGGGAAEVELPQLKYDPKLIEDALYFSPSFANVSPGDQFITTVAYYNNERHKIDEIDLWIKYNPEQVAPVWADTKKLKELNPGPVESRVWADKGYLHLAAKLAAPPKGFTAEFADIHWRALTPTLESRIELTGPAGKVTAVREAGKNVVEGKTGGSSQKVSASITVTPLNWEEPGLRTSDQVDNMAEPAPLDRDKRLRLAIVSPKKDVATGEVATADVMLLNPSALAFDDLKMRIRFNPDEVTILDADQDNFIADGLNIYDGNFHQQFPFDGHISNQVDLEHGVIDYQVGSVMGPRVFPTGTFARIVYRMKRSAGKAAFWFEAEDPLLRVRQTDVTAAGRSLLGDETAVAEQALHGIEIAVKPLDLKPLDRKLEALATAERAQ